MPVSRYPLPLVVSMCSQKGGVGKSTLARALAVAVSAGGKVKVRIVDVDELQETAQAWAACRERLGLKPPIPVTVAGHLENLRSLTGDADVLIVDAPGRASRETLMIARQSHLVVQPTGGSSDDLAPGLALYHELLDAGLPRSRLVWALSPASTRRPRNATCGRC